MTQHTPGPWKWQGEDYRGGWGWQMLVGPNGEGLIVGQAIDGGISPHLRGHMPVAPELCITGMMAEGKEHAEPVHVFSEANARLIAAAPDLLEALKYINQAYVNLLETGRDRIIALGGQCDSVEIMEVADPALVKIRAAIAKATGGQ